jgi:hypothetical protein
MEAGLMIAEAGIICTSFEGMQRIASGDLNDVVLKTKDVLERGESGSVLIFDNSSSELIEVDFRGTAREILGRLAKSSEFSARHEPVPAEIAALVDEVPRGPGRPKLGVVAREVTLLPRHWDWLNAQSGGASVALRKLVEEARRTNENKERIRRAQESAYRFLSAMAGNLPGFEEATRALFTSDVERFNGLVEDWPEDVRDHAKMLVAACV